MQMPPLWQVIREAYWWTFKGYSAPGAEPVDYIFSRPDKGVVWVLPRGRFSRLRSDLQGSQHLHTRGNIGNYELVLAIRKGEVCGYHINNMPIETLNKRIREIESTRE